MTDIAATDHQSNAPIRAELIGSDQCNAGGLSITGTAPILAVCRALIEAGCAPTTALQAWRGTTLCLSVRTLAEGAKLAIDENRMDYRPYRAFPCAPVPPPVSLKAEARIPSSKTAPTSLSAAAP